MAKSDRNPGKLDERRDPSPNMAQADSSSPIEDGRTIGFEFGYDREDVFV
jgi:hypothetical protein